MVKVKDMNIFKIMEMIDKSYVPNKKDDEYWNKNTEKLLRPSKNLKSGWIEENNGKESNWILEKNKI